MKTLTKAIAQARKYEMNGTPENLKKMIRGQRKELGQKIDTYKVEQREKYQEIYWN